MFMAVEWPSTKPKVVFSMIAGSYCQRRRCFTIFLYEEMTSLQPIITAHDLSKFSNKTAVKDWVGDSLLTYS